jgi:hypothetical protein
MLTKHIRVSFSRTDIPRENSMPVAKHPFDARSRAQLSLSQRIDRSVFSGQHVHVDEAPRRPSPRAKLTERVRSMCAGLALLAAYASALPSLAVTIVSWIAAETLAGCAAYATAMYPALALEDLTDPAEPGPSESRPSGFRSAKNAKPDLRVISSDNPNAAVRNRASQLLDVAQSRGGGGADVVLVFQREQKPGARSGWRAAIIAAATRFWSRIRRIRARRPTIAELQSLDERTRRDIGRSAVEIEATILYGARPE